MNPTPQALHDLLHHVAAVYAREADKTLLEQYNIGFSQFRILNSIQENPALRQKYIAFELGQTEASVSRQVALLSDKGMLMVRINPQNRREHSIHITPKGMRLIEAARESLQRYQSSVLRHLSKQQQDQLLELLASLYR